MNKASGANKSKSVPVVSKSVDREIERLRSDFNQLKMEMHRKNVSLRQVMKENKRLREMKKRIGFGLLDILDGNAMNARNVSDCTHCTTLQNEILRLKDILDEKTVRSKGKVKMFTNMSRQNEQLIAEELEKLKRGSDKFDFIKPKLPKIDECDAERSEISMSVDTQSKIYGFCMKFSLVIFVIVADGAVVMASYYLFGFGNKN